MGHTLTSTAACKEAEAMTLEKSQLGRGARVLECKRHALATFDLAYTVVGAGGVEKSVVVTDRALRLRLRRAGVAKD